MIIANPIYDTVFKKMMENERVAKFFIGTIMSKQIESIQVQPQEITYNRDFGGIALYRLDFVATVKTDTGEYTKTLIEVQTSFKKIDMIRFRRYLGEQYTREDVVENEITYLPITTIYVLGFNLPEFETACVKIGRNYIDLINEKVINKKSNFAERITHESYIVQVQRISDRYQTSLDKLLSVFEQRNFIEDSKTVKRFLNPTDTEDVKILTDILHKCGTEPEERRELENEESLWKSFNYQFGKEPEEMLKSIMEKDTIIEEKEIALKEKDKVLEEKDKALEEKNKALEEMAKQLAEMKRKQGEN